ncbi:MAG: methyl-accepting chemotaxis protein [Xanthobacteraceae bacterium]
MLSIKNVSISTKVFFAPVLITLFMIAMAAAAQYGAMRQSEALSQFAKQTMPKSLAVARASDFTVQANMDLYRTVSWAANSQEAKKVEEGAKSTRDNIKRAKDELLQFGDRWALGAQDKAQRDAAAAALEKYSDSATNVLDMVSSDAATAFIFLINADQTFEEVKLQLVELRNTQSTQTEQTTDDAFKAERQSRLLFLSLFGVALAAAVIVTVLVARAISRPIAGMTRAMTALAGGDQSVTVPETDCTNEIGRMAEAVQIFKSNMIEADRLRAEHAAAEQRAVAQRKTDMQNLADQFQAAVGSIVDTVSSASAELESAAGTLTKTAEETQSLSVAVAAASEQASANVQSVASGTEELTSSVGEISRQVRESSRIAREAVKQAQQTDARINELSQAASRIGDVVKLITAIAEQTNLLALNATIEAARAGEAGRGFAVVASEVKLLASQTAKATGEISSQIAGMQSATQESVAAIKEIGATIGRISEISSTIAAAVEEQGAATQEIARNIGEAAQGTAQVATNITDVNRGASETGSASTLVLSSARSLASESNDLKREVDQFLSTVRAA